jgi:hypothetical protein
MSLWNEVKADLERGVKEGIEAIKGGATFVKEKTEELTEEGKKRLRLFELKSKVRKEMTELGGHIYDLKFRVKNPLADSKVKAVMGRIRKLEDHITKIEGNTKEAIKKIPAKIKTRKGEGTKKMK